MPRPKTTPENLIDTVFLSDSNVKKIVEEISNEIKGSHVINPFSFGGLDNSNRMKKDVHDILTGVKDIKEITDLIQMQGWKPDADIDKIIDDVNKLRKAYADLQEQIESTADAKYSQYKFKDENGYYSGGEVEVNVKTESGEWAKEWQEVMDEGENIGEEIGATIGKSLVEELNVYVGRNITKSIVDGVEEALSHNGVNVGNIISESLGLGESRPNEDVAKRLYSELINKILIDSYESNMTSGGNVYGIDDESVLNRETIKIREGSVEDVNDVGKRSYARNNPRDKYAPRNQRPDLDDDIVDAILSGEASDEEIGEFLDNFHKTNEYDYSLDRIISPEDIVQFSDDSANGKGIIGLITNIRNNYAKILEIANRAGIELPTAFEKILEWDAEIDEFGNVQGDFSQDSKNIGVLYSLLNEGGLDKIIMHMGIDHWKTSLPESVFASKNYKGELAELDKMEDLDTLLDKTVSYENKGGRDFKNLDSILKDKKTFGRGDKNLFDEVSRDAIRLREIFSYDVENVRKFIEVIDKYVGTRGGRKPLEKGDLDELHHRKREPDLWDMSVDSTFGINQRRYFDYLNGTFNPPKQPVSNGKSGDGYYDLYIDRFDKNLPDPYDISSNRDPWKPRVGNDYAPDPNRERDTDVVKTTAGELGEKGLKELFGDNVKISDVSIESQKLIANGTADAFFGNPNENMGDNPQDMDEEEFWKRMWDGLQNIKNILGMQEIIDLLAKINERVYVFGTNVSRALTAFDKSLNSLKDDLANKKFGFDFDKDTPVTINTGNVDNRIVNNVKHYNGEDNTGGNTKGGVHFTDGMLNSNWANSKGDGWVNYEDRVNALNELKDSANPYRRAVAERALPVAETMQHRFNGRKRNEDLVVGFFGYIDSSKLSLEQINSYWEEHDRLVKNYASKAKINSERITNEIESLDTIFNSYHKLQEEGKLTKARVSNAKKEISDALKNQNPEYREYLENKKKLESLKKKQETNPYYVDSEGKTLNQLINETTKKLNKSKAEVQNILRIFEVFDESYEKFASEGASQEDLLKPIADSLQNRITYLKKLRSKAVPQELLDFMELEILAYEALLDEGVNPHNTLLGGFNQTIDDYRKSIMSKKGKNPYRGSEKQGFFATQLVNAKRNIEKYNETKKPSGESRKPSDKIDIVVFPEVFDAIEKDIKKLEDEIDALPFNGLRTHLVNQLKTLKGLAKEMAPYVAQDSLINEDGFSNDVPEDLFTRAYKHRNASYNYDTELRVAEENEQSVASMFGLEKLTIPDIRPLNIFPIGEMGEFLANTEKVKEVIKGLTEDREKLIKRLELTAKYGSVNGVQEAIKKLETVDVAIKTLFPDDKRDITINIKDAEGSLDSRGLVDSSSVKSATSDFEKFSRNFDYATRSVQGVQNALVTLFKIVGTGNALVDMTTASSLRQTNKIMLSARRGQEEATKLYDRIQMLVVELPGNDTFLTNILTMLGTMDKSLTGSDLEYMGGVIADYYMGAQAKGQFNNETERELRNYLMTGQTRNLTNSIIASEIESLKGLNTVKERTVALEKALQATGMDSIAHYDSYTNTFEEFKGRFQKSFADLGDLYLGFVQLLMKVYNFLDRISGSLLSQFTIVGGVGLMAMTLITMGIGRLLGAVGNVSNGLKAMRDFVGKELPEGTDRFTRKIQQLIRQLAIKVGLVKADTVAELENTGAKEANIVATLKQTIARWQNMWAVFNETDIVTLETVAENGNFESKVIARIAILRQTLARWLHTVSVMAEEGSLWENTKATIVNALEKIKSAIASAWDTATKWAGVVAQNAMTVSTWLLNGALAILNILLSPIGIAILVIVGAIALFITGIEKLGEAFGWWTDFGSMIEAISAGIGRIWDAFMNSEQVQYAMYIIGGFFENLQALFGSVSVLGGIWEMIFGTPGGAGDWDIVDTIINFLGAIGNALWTLSSLDEILEIIRAIGAYIGWVLRQWNAFVKTSEFQELIDGFREIRVALGEMWAEFEPIFKELGQAWAELWGSGDYESLKKDGNELLELFKAIAHFIRDYVIPFIKLLIPLIKATLTPLMITLRAITKIIESVKWVIDHMPDWMAPDGNTQPKAPTLSNDQIHQVQQQNYGELYARGQDLAKTYNNSSNNPTIINNNFGEGSVQTNAHNMTQKEVRHLFTSAFGYNKANGVKGVLR